MVEEKLGQVNRLVEECATAAEDDGQQRVRLAEEEVERARAQLEFSRANAAQYHAYAKECMRTGNADRARKMLLLERQTAAAAAQLEQRLRLCERTLNALLHEQLK